MAPGHRRWISGRPRAGPSDADRLPDTRTPARSTAAMHAGGRPWRGLGNSGFRIPSSPVYRFDTARGKSGPYGEGPCNAPYRPFNRTTPLAARHSVPSSRCEPLSYGRRDERGAEERALEADPDAGVPRGDDQDVRPGWFRADAALAPRRKRPSACASAATVSERNSRATVRPKPSACVLADELHDTRNLGPAGPPVGSVASAVQRTAKRIRPRWTQSCTFARGR
jgi:hypothetical protein